MYDLFRANRVLCCGGAYHTGVVIKDKEYSFGCVSGVCWYKPKTAKHVIYKTTIPMGFTNLP